MSYLSFCSASFAQRQQIDEQRRRAKDEERQRKATHEQSRWFKPRTTEKSTAILSRTRPEQLMETVAERSERMACQAVAKREDRLQQLEHEVYGHLSFRPAIDPLSRALGRESDVGELSENPRGRRLREAEQQRAQEREARECSFQPRINEASRQLLRSAGEEGGGPAEQEEDYLRRYRSEFAQRGWAESAGTDDGTLYPKAAAAQELSLTPRTKIVGRVNMHEPEKMARDIRLRLLEREERRRAELLVREVEELRECTFRPAVAPYVAYSSAQPVVVRGLGRHLELRHLSAKQKEEARQREKDAFSVRNVERYRRAEDGSTIVQVTRRYSSLAA